MSVVLVVDDDRLQLETVEMALTRAGHQVLTASDGRRGVEMLAKHRVDVMVLDILMPGQEGIETIIALQRLPTPPVIIAISGASGGILNAAEKLGARYSLAKPFTQKQLLELIDRCTPAAAES